MFNKMSTGLLADLASKLVFASRNKIEWNWGRSYYENGIDYPSIEQARRKAHRGKMCRRYGYQKKHKH